MMITKFLQRAFLLIFLVVPLSASAEDEHFTEMFVFGDSLSDNGNLAVLPGFEFLSNFPFAGGFTNESSTIEDDFAVEVLASGLGLQAEPSLFLPSLFPGGPLFIPQGTNYAVAGARAAPMGDGFPIDLPVQVGVFLQAHFGVAPQDALFVVFIGGNDVRDARDAGSKEAAKQIIRDAVAGIDSAIRTLAWSGAENFLVANVPDIGAIPETRAEGGQELAKRATNLSRRFNGLLEETIEEIEDDLEVEIAEFNMFRFLRSVIKNADTLGFTNTQDPCLFSPACDFESFVFFDGIHPTARAHALAGEAMLRLVVEGDED